MKNKKLSSKLLTFLISACFIVSLFAIACEPTQTVSPSLTPATSVSKYGGTFRSGQSLDVLTIGWPATINAMPDIFASQACIETLARYDEKASLAPHLAEKWVMDEKAKTITITLRKGVKFHDGTDFNAKACKWNLDTYQRVTKRPQYSSITSVDIVDDYTVRLNLSIMDNTLDQILAAPFCMMISPTAYEKAGTTEKERTDWAIKNPVGTGPFKFVSWTRDVKMVFEKNPDYWQKGKPYIDRFEYVVIPDILVQLASLQRGEIDQVAVQPKDAAELQKTNKFVIASLPSGIGAALRGLVGDSAHPDSPFSNVKVRQAVSSAIDNDAINVALYNGMAQKMTQLSKEGTWGYNSSMAGFPYNPAKAKSLLAEAGYPNGFKTKIFCRTDKATVDLYTAIQGYLSKVGIDASIDALANNVHDQMSKTTGWTNGLMQYGVKVEADPLIIMFRTHHAGSELYSTATLHVDEIDKLMDQAKTVPDFNTKQTLVRQLQQQLFEKYALATPIINTPTISAKSLKVHDDKIREIEGSAWRPEDIWLEK